MCEQTRHEHPFPQVVGMGKATWQRGWPECTKDREV